MVKTNPNFESAYLKLNPEQKKAVDAIEGPVLVLAGPGTGKTQMLVTRIGKILLETQINPANILCLTFTESAATQMKNRLVELIGRDAYYVRIQTFHSFCNEVIAENPEKFLQISDMEPLDDLERVEVVNICLEKLPPQSHLKPIAAPDLYVKDIISDLSDLKREGILISQYAQVIAETEKFITESKTIFENFFVIPWQKRTKEDCLSFSLSLSKTEETSKLKEYTLSVIDNFLNSNSELKLPRGNPYTLLKDQVKKFFDQTVERLPKQKELIGAYEAYQHELATRKRYDYEDMILYVLEKFRTDDALLAKYQENFQYILVDEYQDTNSAQNEIVKILGSFFDNPNIFCVGDDDQSIYRFQGASLENILEFEKKYGHTAKTVVLTKNYRSSQLILDAATGLIKNNQQRATNYLKNVSNDLRAQNEKGNEKISVCALESERSENYFLAKEIEKIIKSGVEPKEIAVLFRKNSDCLDLVDLFLRLDIPFKLQAGKNILEEVLIKQLLDLLTFVSDYKREDRLFFILESDYLDFSDIDVNCLVRFAYDNRKDAFAVLKSREDLESAGVKETEKFVKFSEQLLKWQKDSYNKTLEEFFDKIIRESGFLSYVLNSPKKLEYLNKLNTLFDLIKTLNRKDHRLNLQKFLERIDLLYQNNLPVVEQVLETEKNSVNLMTAHKAKGREFSYVFIIRALDKHWGNTRDNNKLKLPFGLLELEDSPEDNDEDERRLFYVAMTRAKEKIYITYSKGDDQEKAKVPTIYLSEIDKKFLEFEDVSKVEEESLARLQTIFLEPVRVEEKRSEAEKEWILGLIANYKMSVTDLNTFLRCPRQFYYQNLIKVPAVKSFSQSLGTAVHRVLRNWSLALSYGEKYNRERLQRDFERALEREILSEGELSRANGEGKEYLSDYFENYKDYFSPSSLVEYNFSSHGVNVSGVPITGMLDKVEILDHKTKIARVIDFKTGNPDSKNKDLKEGGDYYRQIVFYKLLCDNSPRFGFHFSLGEINFIEKSKKSGGFVKKEYNVSQAETQNLIAEIKRVYQEITSLEFLHLSEERMCGECEFCLMVKN